MREQVYFQITEIVLLLQIQSVFSTYKPLLPNIHLQSLAFEDMFEVATKKKHNTMFHIPQLNVTNDKPCRIK